jgi:arylsulfatase A-like enzyme
LTFDLTATLLAAAGASPPRGRSLDGLNLLPILTGKQPLQSRTVFWRYKRGNQLRKAARSGYMKLVIDQGKEELHDLAADELEQKNLLPGAEAIAQDLRAKLAAWEQEVAAPRVRGFRPAGA